MLQDLYRLATTGGVPRSALKVAVVVGTLLNLINQGDALFAGGPLVYWKIGLTYCVPYLVSTYGAVMARRQMEALQKAAAAT